MPLAEQVRKGADVLTGALGMITDAAQAEQILTEGKADLVILARQLLRDPYWPRRALAELGADPQWPAQYIRAF